jgi:hypothetical protein
MLRPPMSAGGVTFIALNRERMVSDVPNDLRRAHETARQFVRLLDEPEVGLMSWHMLLGQKIEALRDLLNKLMPPPEPSS